MNCPNIQAIIFDHDGTLVNSETIHLDCWNQVLAPYGCELTQADYLSKLSGMPSQFSAEWLAANFTLDEHPNALLKRKQLHLHHFLSHSAYPLMPDTKTLLQNLHQHGMPLAIASGADLIEVKRSVEFHNLKGYFSAIVTRDHVAQNKPSPDVYLKAADLLSIDPRYCVALEDSDNGEASALAAGMTCVRVHTSSPFSHAGSIGCLDFAALNAWFSLNIPGYTLTSA